MRSRHVMVFVTLVSLIGTIVPVDAQVRGGRRGAIVRGRNGKAVAVGRGGVAVRGEDGKAVAIGRNGVAARGEDGKAVAVGRNGVAARGEDGRAVAVGRNGVAARGEDGYAAVGRRGAVVAGDEGYAAVGRRGAVVRGEDGYAAVGRRAAVVAGEEGYAAVGRRGVIVGRRYDSYEGWRVAAGVGAAIAVGTLLARPPQAAVTLEFGNSNYWYHDGVYFTRVISSGAVSYQVIDPPVGIVIGSLPGGCGAIRVGGLTYSRCGDTYYQRVGGGYRVVVLP